MIVVKPCIDRTVCVEQTQVIRMCVVMVRHKEGNALINVIQSEDRNYKKGGTAQAHILGLQHICGAEAARTIVLSPKTRLQCATDPEHTFRKGHEDGE